MKATKFCKISTLLLSVCTVDKTKVEISQNFVALSEYTNFKTNKKVCYIVKFIYSEKATKFCEIFPLLLSTVHTDKSKGKISQNFVAFTEYMNFKSPFFYKSVLEWEWVWPLFLGFPTKWPHGQQPVLQLLQSRMAR